MKEIKNRQPKDNNGAKEIDLTKEEQKAAESSRKQRAKGIDNHEKKDEIK